MAVGADPSDSRLLVSQSSKKKGEQVLGCGKYGSGTRLRCIPEAALELRAQVLCMYMRFNGVHFGPSPLPSPLFTSDGARSDLMWGERHGNLGADPPLIFGHNFSDDSEVRSLRRTSCKSICWTSW